MIAERLYLPFDEVRRAAYVTPTAVIVTKLRAYGDSQSTRHLDDIASVVRLQGNKLDRERLDIAAARQGLIGVWRVMGWKPAGLTGRGAKRAPWGELLDRRCTPCPLKSRLPT
jgi:hypothetical protein